jgi:O-antigen/teichoic acid export membrane protein
MTLPVEATPRDPLAGLPRHGLLNVAATLVPGVYSALLVSYFLHTLGPAGYAPWAAAMALVGWLVLLDAGLASTTTREAARALAGHHDAAERVGTSNTLYAGLGICAVGLGAAASVVIPLILRLAGDQARDAWLVGVALSVDLGIVLGTSAWMGVLRGARRFEYVLAANVLQVAVALTTTVALLPVLGLVGAGCGQIAGRLASRALAAVLVRRAAPWFDLLPRPQSRRTFGQVTQFSLPILAIQLAKQIGTGTDIFVVGAVASSTAVGLYAAGSQLPRYTSQFLFPTFAVLLPAFSSIVVRDPRLARGALLRGLLVCSILGSATFGSLALEPRRVLDIWAGGSDQLSVGVLQLYAVAMIAVTPANVLTLMLIAHGRHSIIGALVLIEALVNLALSIVLALIVGPIGVAISSLTVILVDDLLVIPYVASRRLDVPLRELAAWIGGGFAAGLVVAAAIWVLPLPGLPGFGVKLVIGAALLGAVVLLAWRATSGHTADASERNPARARD